VDCATGAIAFYVASKKYLGLSVVADVPLTSFALVDLSLEFGERSGAGDREKVVDEDEQDEPVGTCASSVHAVVFEAAFETYRD
jgi:hypothetical protein